MLLSYSNTETEYLGAIPTMDLMVAKADICSYKLHNHIWSSSKACLIQQHFYLSLNDNI